MARKNLIIWILKIGLLILLLVSVFWPKRNLVKEWREKQRIEKEIQQWEQTLAKYPGHRDILIRLAFLNWQIKNDDQAQEYLQKAKHLDPNSETVQELEKIIQE